MYLSKIMFRAGNASHQALLHIQQKGSYASHQLLWTLFPKQEQRHFLFREDKSDGGRSGVGMPEYLLLSATPPKIDSEFFSVKSKHFSPQLSVGDRLAFRLRANPTVSITSNSKTARGKRHDVMMHAKTTARRDGVTDPQQLYQYMNQAALDWLMDPRRRTEWGIDFDVQPNVVASYQHQAMKRHHAIRYTSVDYEGILTVRDPAKLLTVLAQGVGRSKAFGCGLLLLRRI